MFTTQPRISADAAAVARVPSRSMARRFYIGVTLFMIAIVLAGFWPSYFGRYARGLAVGLPWVIHLHAATFMGWMALLLAQVSLVSTGRTRLHRKVGAFGIAYGGLILVMGLLVSFAAPLHHLAVGDWEMDRAAGEVLSGLSNMVLFAGFFAAAVTYRRRPEIHKG